MSKLRIVKDQRISSPENASLEQMDIRDLGDKELINNSGFEVRLYLKKIEVIGELDSFLKAYNLEYVVDPVHSGYRFLRSKSRKVGMHKINTVDLFVAAIELNEIYPESQLLLLQFNSLKYQIEKRLEGRPVLDHDTKQILKSWKKTAPGLTLALAPQIWLNQAGIQLEINLKNEVSTFTNTQIENIKSKLNELIVITEQSGKDGPIKIRKAG